MFDEQLNQVNTISQAAEFGLESGRLWLVDQISKGGTSPIVIANTRKLSISGDCLGLRWMRAGRL